MTVGVVDGLALHGLVLHGGRGQRAGTGWKITAASTWGFDWGRFSIILLPCSTEMSFIHTTVFRPFFQDQFYNCCGRPME